MLRTFFERRKPHVAAWLALCLWLAVASPGQAQNAYSLQQAIDYALQNNNSVKNAQLDIVNANARIGETRAIGLPQLSGQAQLVHNIKIQQVILENGAGPFGDPSRPIGSVLAFPFQLKNLGGVTATASQLLFNSSYLVGLQAARAYRELSEKSMTSAKVNVVEAVTKAYYAVLVNREQFGLLNANVDRLEKLLNETREFNKNGLVEKIDVDRLEVQFNNLQVQAKNTERLVALAENALKFQMGMPVNEPITVTEKLADLTNVTFASSVSGTVNYDQRIEYSLLQNQRQLNELDVRNARSNRYPNLAASFTAGYNPAASRLGDITQSGRWISYSLVAFQLNVPIWNFGTSHVIQQKKVAVRKTENEIEQFRKAADFQLQSANTTLLNAMESLKTQQRNLDLANEVVRVTRIKYQQGVGSNIEVVNAEVSLREAQTNYYAALYDALIAKVDLNKATGELYK
jgi:outer membrane protein TolC